MTSDETPRDDSEARVRAAFEEIRAADAAGAPPFAGLWGRPAARRSLLVWLVPAGAAAVVVLAVLAVGIVPATRDRTAAPPALDGEPAALPGVVDPEPLAFLLERPAGGQP